MTSRIETPDKAISLLREALESEIDRFMCDERTSYPDHEVLEAFDRLRAALSATAGPPTPSPTGTELALDEAKRHIAILTKFWMDNDAWHGASEAARAFISGVPSLSATAGKP